MVFLKTRNVCRSAEIGPPNRLAASMNRVWDPRCFSGHLAKSPYLNLRGEDHGGELWNSTSSNGIDGKICGLSKPWVKVQI